MITRAADAPAPGADTSLSALTYIHNLLCRPAAEQDGLPALLAELATAFDAQAVELRPLLEEAGHIRVGAAGPGWEPNMGWQERVQRSRLAVTVPLQSGGQGLVTLIEPLDQPGWWLWLEDARRSDWTAAEAGALTLAGQTLERWLASGERSAPWLEQLERRRGQQRLEIVAQVTRRLAHDLGNVFTGILGFTELSLAHPAQGNAQLQSYLNEIHRSAQAGAGLTHQLRLFSRRQAGRHSHCALLPLLLGQTARLQNQAEPRGKLVLDVPADLPQVALDAEQLTQVLSALVDNAVEASPRGTAVLVSANLAELDASSRGDYFGCLQPGPHVRLCIADHGPGMTADQWRQVLVEPLFTTKPRHRGLGLAVAYGILHAHRGGLRLRPGPDAGVLAEVLLPLATGSLLPKAPAKPAKADAGARVLVVDDDPLVLSFVRATLEQAGYRVNAVSTAEEALRSYTAAHRALPAGGLGRADAPGERRGPGPPAAAARRQRPPAVHERPGQQGPRPT